MPLLWTVIIPVKPAAVGKSRLGLGPELSPIVARAIALDTIVAAASAASVSRVLVVTADPHPLVELVETTLPAMVSLPTRTAVTSLRDASEPASVAPGGANGAGQIVRVEVVREDAARGISAAIATGISATRAGENVAVLLGDLPSLLPGDLDAALAAAEAYPRAFVADAEGTGTTLATALAGTELITAFGADSAARHADLGLVELPIPLTSTVRRDVDTVPQLGDARARGLGPHTSAVV